MTEKIKDLLETDHICYSVSYDDLVKSWVLLNFRKEFALIFWDAKTNLSALKELGLFFFEVELYDAEILVVQASSMDDTISVAKEVLKMKESGIEVSYFQVWALGQLLFDSIDIDIFKP